MTKEIKPFGIGSKASINTVDASQWPHQQAGQILMASQKAGMQDPVKAALDKLSEIIFGDRAGMLERISMYEKMGADISATEQDLIDAKKKIGQYWEGAAFNAFSSVVDDYSNKAGKAKDVVKSLVDALNNFAGIVADTWAEAIECITSMVGSILDAYSDFIGAQDGDPIKIATGGFSALIKALNGFIQAASKLIQDAIKNMSDARKAVIEAQKSAIDLQQMGVVDVALRETNTWTVRKTVA